MSTFGSSETEEMHSSTKYIHKMKQRWIDDKELDGWLNNHYSQADIGKTQQDLWQWHDRYGCYNTETHIETEGPLENEKQITVATTQLVQNGKTDH